MAEVVSSGMQDKERLDQLGRLGRDPRPHPDAVAVVGRARFTWLGPSVLRLEWAEDAVFEDRASLVAVHRRLDPPAWTLVREGDLAVLEGAGVTLRYRTAADGFEDALEVLVERGGRRLRWTPGMEPIGNLGGTVRTLDGEAGHVDLGMGLLSRDGWVWIDDSGTPLLGDAPSSWVEPRLPGRRTDGYLLLHGEEYADALRDWSRIGGAVPLPPRWAFGIWWSRYWAYTDSELLELVREHARLGVPLDVLVVDMDWHETFELRWGRGEKDAAGQRKGWTGYTWNPAYFPDPDSFLGSAHGAGVRVALNLHPASGVQPWEERYAEVAEATGQDPAAGEHVPFRIEEPRFARAFMDRVIRPLERQGVDFWWLDWQQWSDTDVPGLTPTMWLNHVFFTEMEGRATKRPIILHRFGGLGSHRYQVGFSGDAASTWEALRFQPEMTATAANVLYGYWSHDIGGHEPGPVEAELYTRWIQLGALSPILRTHATRHPDAERRFWAFPPDAAAAMRRALRLRQSLVPYLYTAARACHDTGLSIVRPLYLGWPGAEEAYTHPDHHQLGPDLVAAPVTEPAGDDGLARRAVWLPPGSWIEWDSGERLVGGFEHRRSFALDELALYARAGAVIPRAPEGTRAGAPSGVLVLSVFPGADGSCRLYEDAGDDLGYLRGAFRWTPVSASWQEGGRLLRLTVGQAEGGHPGAPSTRDLHVRVHDVPPPERVWVDGVKVESARPSLPDAGGWGWDGEGLELTIEVPGRAVDRPTDIVVELRAPADAIPPGTRGLLRRLRQAVETLHRLWPEDDAPDALVALAQSGRRATLRPATAVDELSGLHRSVADLRPRVDALRGDRALALQALALLEPRDRGR